jgi:hypothetical protein
MKDLAAMAAAAEAAHAHPDTAGQGLAEVLQAHAAALAMFVTVHAIAMSNAVPMMALANLTRVAAEARQTGISRHAMAMMEIQKKAIAQSAIDKILSSGTLSLSGISTKVYTSGKYEVESQNESASSDDIDYNALSGYLSQIDNECVSNNGLGGFTVDGADLIYAMLWPVPRSA